MNARALTSIALSAAAISALAGEKVIITQFDLSDKASDRGEVLVGATFDGMADIRDNAWRLLVKRDGAPAEMLKP